MAKGINQKLKLLYIAQILEQKTDEAHPMSSSKLIEELDKYGISAERKTIYDDIAQLQDFGYDILLNQSKRNGGYYIASRAFELPELKVLVDTVQSSRFITAKKSGELIGKLEKLCSEYDEKELKRQVIVANRIKSDNECIYYAVNDIYHAMQNNRKIAFQYLIWNVKGEKVPKRNGEEYVVSPFSLSFNDGNYYLIAYDSNAQKIKHYRVDKMKSVRELTDTRDGIEIYKNFDVVGYINKTFNMYGGTECGVTLSCPSSMVGIFIDRFGDGAVLYDTGHEMCEVRVQVAISGQFFGWLAGIGPNVKILTPQAVAKEYKDYLQSIVDSL